jgi:putative hydrolase
MTLRNLADLHTHTVASGHAYSTVAELAASARERGLELIAVTDHGPRCPGAPHEWHFMNLKVVPSVIGGVTVLKGVEANLVPDTSNGMDLADEMLEQLDFVAVGFHPGCGYDETGIDWRTEALCSLMENALVDMVTHPGNAAFPLHVDTVVECAVEHGVIVELNSGSFEPSATRSRETSGELDFARAAVDAGALVAVTSDAHFHAHVGRFERALEVAERLGLREDRLISRDAASVLAYLHSRRDRPRLGMGGVI